MDYVGIVNKRIEAEYNKNGVLPKIIIFPFGAEGRALKTFLKEAYDMEPAYIIDSFYSKYNPNIKPLSFLKEINCEEYLIIIATTHPINAYKLEKLVLEYVNADNVLDLTEAQGEKRNNVGRYSYGPLCDGRLQIESVGNFSSIATGAIVVGNHNIDCISTHPTMYFSEKDFYGYSYEEAVKKSWYIEGITPKDKSHKNKKTKIGHDVWIGYGVTITNGANIGNGAIVGAGAVVTKDVPDYAIVGGVPAKVIRYRYNKDQIAALNRIQWWNWSDDEIRERYDDFFINIDEFIAKYDIREEK